MVTLRRGSAGGLLHRPRVRLALGRAVVRFTLRGTGYAIDCINMYVMLIPICIVVMLYNRLMPMLYYD